MDEASKAMISTMAMQNTILRGVITLMLAKKDVTPENVLDVVRPLMNPGMTLKSRKLFEETVRQVVSGINDTVHRLEGSSKLQ